MKFEMEVPSGGKFCFLRVERIHQSDFTEQYKVSGVIGIIVLQTDWPVQRRKHLNKKPHSWKLVEGKIDSFLLDTIIIYLEKAVRKKLYE
jgi:hypothetical protein